MPKYLRIRPLSGYWLKSMARPSLEHPFFIKDKGWVKSGDLVEGDNVMLYNGNWQTITKVSTERLDTSETTYNFEVQDYHTYYVGKHGVLCHNMCGGVEEVVEGPQSVNDVNFNVKNANYINKRGWTMDSMDTAIKGGIKGTTTNLATDNMAFVYTASI